jgi:NNP family nitrate/nitrite transporter-like MFS transporter
MGALRTAAAPPPSGPAALPAEGNTLQLVLATGAFAVCFAVFGSESAQMAELERRLQLTEFQVGVALALPVLLGSLGRIPMGILTDRLGGRRVFLLVLLGSLPPALLMPFVGDYAALLACGFFFGLPLAVFPVGVGFVNGWYPPHRQGLALGVYGAGNIGQSLAAFGAPVLAAAAGFAWGFWAFAGLAAAWLGLFAALARDAPRSGPAKTWGDFLRPLGEPMSWDLSLYYFLTFGGFVAMSIYLPKFLRGMFDLTPMDAGFRTAGFVVLATVMRPVGGWLADRVGGSRILIGVFPAVAVFAVFLACPMMSTFTAGALGMAAAIGLGNGAVFRLVPDYFPRVAGSVSGLVGAAGGLGGFFPPLVVGALRQSTGSFTPGFVLLSIFAAACLLLCWLVRPGPCASSQPGTAH